MDEFGLIQKLKRFQCGSKALIKGIGDDTAVFEFSRTQYQLFTTDMMAEDVHFTRKMPAVKVGWKAMASNVSDIAAMGGTPTFAVVSLGVTRNISQTYILGLYRGMKKCADRFGVSIVGGDTVKSDKLIINVALLGRVDKKRLVLRSGARPGDRIYVTGRLGGSFKSGRHLTFMPRVKEAQAIVEGLHPTAMLDISDGLAGDLGHILEESRVGAVLYAERIPCHKGVALEQALREGEDYELLFTARPSGSRGVSEKSFTYHEIGEIIGAKGKLLLKNAEGRTKQIAAKAFTHF